MTSYVSKDQGVLDVSVHDPFKIFSIELAIKALISATDSVV